MPRPDATPALDAAAAVARSTSGLKLLVLFGSRARGDNESGADWDFGYLARDEADVPGLLAALVEALGDDRVDLADLGRASGLLRYHAARDGQLLFEATPDAFDRFRLDATRFWCDVAPMLERGYAEVLEALSP
jgi:predicted nucleotidyltransferase